MTRAGALRPKKRGGLSATGRPIFTFDIDSLDPSQAPGTGTPEAGGITALEALRLLRSLRGIDFVGGDLVEVSPPFDVGTITAFNGASILFEILSLLVEILAGAQTGLRSGQRRKRAWIRLSSLR